MTYETQLANRKMWSRHCSLDWVSFRQVESQAQACFKASAEISYRLAARCGFICDLVVFQRFLGFKIQIEIQIEFLRKKNYKKKKTI